MEAKFVMKVTDLTSDFIEGIGKVFSKDAVFHITVEYGNVGTATSAKKRGRKPSIDLVTTPAPTGKKRGRKPGPAKTTVTEVTAVPKKRGRKPKVASAE